MTVKTGQVEPTWPVIEGGRVIEYSLAGAVLVVQPPADPNPPTLPPEIDDRYDQRQGDDTIRDYRQIR